MTSVVFVFNALCYALAHTLLASAIFNSRSPARYVACFILLLALPFVAISVGNDMSLLNLVVYMLCFYEKSEGKQIFYCSITTVCLGLSGILLLGAAFMWIFPEHYNSVTYNVYMALGCLAAAVCFKAWQDRSHIAVVSAAGQRYLLILKVVLLAYYVLVLPQYGIGDVRKTGIIVFTAMGTIAAVIFLLARCFRLDERTLIVSRESHCLRLLNRTFERRTHVKGGERNAFTSLDQISPWAFRVQLEEILEGVSSNPNIGYRCHVEGAISIPEEYLLPLMTLNDICIGMAVTEASEAAKQRETDFYISLYGDGRSEVRLQVDNTAGTSAERFEELYTTQESKEVNKILNALPYSSFEQRLYITAQNEKRMTQSISLHLLSQKGEVA